MSNRVLGYTNQDGMAVVLEVHGEEVETILQDCGPSIEFWPEDMGVYNLIGLWIWEGSVDSEDTFKGETRVVTSDELRKLGEGTCPI
jgi:hypothetical protein